LSTDGGRGEETSAVIALAELYPGTDAREFHKVVKGLLFILVIGEPASPGPRGAIGLGEALAVNASRGHALGRRAR
jgi:hypothetical protein